MSSLGKDCYGGTINCDRLVAKNSTDPHKITGDLEVTGNLKVDGGIEVDSAGFKGLNLKSNPSVNQVNIEMNDNTQNWGIEADAGSSQLAFSHTLIGAGSGVGYAGFTLTPGTNEYGAYFGAQPFILNSIPTSATGLPSGAVWSNGGVLNIVP